MILFHFCAGKHIKSILHHGLTEGFLAIPAHCGFSLLSGWTWLTTDPDPNNQSWATKNAIKYDRTAWRLTIEIPDDALSEMYDRAGVSRIYPTCDLLFKDFRGSENWRVYHGRIPKEWIREANEVHK